MNAATTNCPACATLKASGAPFRCNRCRKAAPVEREQRQAVAVALIKAGVPVADAERHAFTEITAAEAAKSYASLTA